MKQAPLRTRGSSKALIPVLAFVLIPALGCQDNTSSDEPESQADTPITTTAPPPAPSPTPTLAAIRAQAVVRAFRDAGLEVGDSYRMSPQDLGLAPLLTRNMVRFLVPSLGADAGGRVFVFRRMRDLRATKRYYDEFGRQSAALFSWTFVNRELLVLVQINGELPESQARKYQRVVQSLER